MWYILDDLSTIKPSQSTNKIITTVGTVDNLKLDIGTKTSPLSSEVTPHVTMEPPNCSSTPFRTPRSIRRGRRNNPFIGSPALPCQGSNEDRILGT